MVRCGPVGALLLAAVTSVRSAWTASSELMYDEAAALAYSYISTAAYCGPPRFTRRGLETWDCGPNCDAIAGMTNITSIGNGVNDAFAFTAKYQGECVAAFRGTSCLGGWIRDLESAGKSVLKGCHVEGTPCYVGSGFLSNYESLEHELKTSLATLDCLGARIVIVGHSLGAAVAAVAMYDLQRSGYTIAKAYTYGQPRVGDETFVNAFRSAFSANATNATVMFRLTHDQDPIVHLPPHDLNFHHTATEIFYPGNVSEGYHICDGSGEDANCSNQFWDLPAMILGCVEDDFQHCDHMSYLFASRTIRMSSTSCTNYVNETT